MDSNRRRIHRMGKMEPEKGIGQNEREQSGRGQYLKDHALLSFSRERDIMTKTNKEKFYQAQRLVQDLCLTEDDTEIQHYLKVINTYIWKIIWKLQ